MCMKMCVQGGICVYVLCIYLFDKMCMYVSCIYVYNVYESMCMCVRMYLCMCVRMYLCVLCACVCTFCVSIVNFASVCLDSRSV